MRYEVGGRRSESILVWSGSYRREVNIDFDPACKNLRKIIALRYSQPFYQHF